MHGDDLSTKEFPLWLEGLKSALLRKLSVCPRMNFLDSEDVCNEGEQEILPEWRRLGGPGIWTILKLRLLFDLTAVDIFCGSSATSPLEVGVTGCWNLSKTPEIPVPDKVQAEISGN